MRLAKYFILSAVLCCSVRAQITVSWGNDAEIVAFSDSSGTLLPVGSLLQIGTFAAGTDFSSTSVTYLQSQFTQYGSSFIGDGGYGIAGYFVASETANAPVSTSLYIWSFNSANALSATEWGIFSDGALWTTASSAPDSMTIDIYQATVANVGKLDGGLAMTGAPIPEPATYALAFGLVTLGFVGYRRWRRV